MKPVIPAAIAVCALLVSAPIAAAHDSGGVRTTSGNDSTVEMDESTGESGDDDTAAETDRDASGENDGERNVTKLDGRDEKSGTGTDDGIVDVEAHGVKIEQDGDDAEVEAGNTEFESENAGAVVDVETDETDIEQNGSELSVEDETIDFSRDRSGAVEFETDGAGPVAVEVTDSGADVVTPAHDIEVADDDVDVETGDIEYENDESGLDVETDDVDIEQENGELDVETNSVDYENDGTDVDIETNRTTESGG